MSLLEKTKLLLRNNRISPNKLLGQHFMIEPLVFAKMGEYASLGRKDVVLDIGAGLGFLTRFLAEKCREVVAIEADEKLANILRSQLADSPNVKVLTGNVLKVYIPQFDKIVSIPPYQISSRLVMWLLNRGFNYAVMVLQREFAERLVAKVGAEQYGLLTVLTYYYAECLLLNEIPKESFYPQPKIDSVIVSLFPKETPPFTLKDKAMFKKIVQSLFTQRNRKVRNAIMPFLRESLKRTKSEASIVAARLPFRDKRVRELAPENFGELSSAVSS